MVASRKLVGIKLAILLEADYNYKDRQSGFNTLNYSKILLEFKKNTEKFGFNRFVLDGTLKLLAILIFFKNFFMHMNELVELITEIDV